MKKAMDILTNSCSEIYLPTRAMCEQEIEDIHRRIHENAFYSLNHFVSGDEINKVNAIRDDSLIGDRAIISEQLMQKLREFIENSGLRTPYYSLGEYQRNIRMRPYSCEEIMNDEDVHRIQDKLETQRRHVENVTNTKYKYFSDSTELRCAVNPMGTCDGCADFEEK